MIVFEYIGFAVVLVMLEFIAAYIVSYINNENYELGLVSAIAILDIFVVGVFVTFINHPDVFGYMYIGG